MSISANPPGDSTRCRVRKIVRPVYDESYLCFWSLESTFFLLRDPQSVFHRASCSIALVIACVSIPLQMLSGDFAAREVAKLEPPMLAAMEAHYQTGTGVPLVVGGIPGR